MKNENILPLGAVPCLRLLDAAIYRSIIYSPSHGTRETGRIAARAAGGKTHP